MTSPTHSRQGFTLIEMIVVLAILGLVAGLIVARGPARSATLEVQQAVALVAQVMRGARAAAIAAGRAQAVEIDPVGHTIRTGTSALLLPGTVAIALVMPSGTTPSATGALQRRIEIRFFPDGSASGGTVVLSHNAERMAVAVDWLTGRVRLSDAR
jgi:general secretion pathway protein H